MKLIDIGRRVRVVSDRPRYNDRIGTITCVTVAYTIALDEMLEAGEMRVVEVRARPHQLRLVD